MNNSALIFLPLTDKLLAAVLDDLWEVSRHELEVWGAEIQDVPSIMANTRFKTAIVTVDDCEPVCAFGGDFGETGVAWTWFLASNLFPGYAHAATRMVRRFLREQAKVYNLRRIVTTSASDHPMAANWFRLLGYREDGETSWKHGLARRYVLDL